MERVRVPWKGWVLVCDGAKALFFVNEGDKDIINLKTMDVAVQDEPPARDLGSDRPGRVYASVGEARSATEETDWHARAEEDFLHRVAAAADKAVHDHAIKHIVLIAPPKALGILRPHLTDAVRGVLQAEIGKDLVRLSTGEIEKHLSASG